MRGWLRPNSGAASHAIPNESATRILLGRIGDALEGCADVPPEEDSCALMNAGPAPANAIRASVSYRFARLQNARSTVMRSLRATLSQSRSQVSNSDHAPYLWGSVRICGKTLLIKSRKDGPVIVPVESSETEPHFTSLRTASMAPLIRANSRPFSVQILATSTGNRATRNPEVKTLTCAPLLTTRDRAR